MSSELWHCREALKSAILILRDLNIPDQLDQLIPSRYYRDVDEARSDLDFALSRALTEVRQQCIRSESLSSATPPASISATGSPPPSTQDKAYLTEPVVLPDL